ncbi:MAG: YcaQ family DNA glycosylase [Candidatus Eisenbacteria bacterium]|nr:YcaQ family DNA glycosylase [Candidatus Eisenbacteria bacterium]
MPDFPRRAATALFLERQHLDRPRARRLTGTSLARFARDTGGLQLDSVNVLDRAHYLTAWSRFGVFDRGSFDRLAYRRRVLFEYWAHCACLVPRGDYPAWRRAMFDHPVRTDAWARWGRSARAKRLLGEIQAEIARRGPLGSSDFEHARDTRGTWWDWKPAAHALHFLWLSGSLLVHSRRNFERRMDLAARVLPEAASEACMSAAEFPMWHIRRSLHAMGAATETDLRMYMSFPRLPAPARRAALRAMLETGEVIEVGIEPGPDAAAATPHPGRRSPPLRWYLLAEDVPALEAASRRRRPSTGTTLLAPFDSLLWHRERVLRLFDFDYRVEIYVPAQKRRYGYYVLPILHDGRMIGRLDAKNHRAERRLEVRSLHFEPGFGRVPEVGRGAGRARAGAADVDPALAGLAGALHSLREFLGADRVSLGAACAGAWSPALRTHLRAAPTGPRPDARDLPGE